MLPTQETAEEIFPSSCKENFEGLKPLKASSSEILIPIRVRGGDRGKMP